MTARLDYCRTCRRSLTMLYGPHDAGESAGPKGHICPECDAGPFCAGCTIDHNAVCDAQDMPRTRPRQW